ncbi:MAG: WD40 repeat domain-containing protein [Spirochaetaceae bacterium]|jgi:hypothetical protein|nr:WD40 repeat domain-containing protein [Spirochaetaceae bacterium]
MTKKKRLYGITLGIFLFLGYVFLAAQPVPVELLIEARWISSLDKGAAEPGIVDKIPSAGSGRLIPFRLGQHFGYVDSAGRFTVNRIQENYISLSPGAWTEYPQLPEVLDIRNPRDETMQTVPSPSGYPVFLDGDLYLMGGDQVSLKALDGEGNDTWTYFFGAPLTGIDAAAGAILAGLLDGTIELISSEGVLLYTFEPGGSRIPCIYGCAISEDASKIALISGLDEQRFLFLEKSGDTYRVAYHESLGEGFRRPVQLYFIDSGRRAVFERPGGLGIFDTVQRKSVTLPLRGNVYAIDNQGGGDFLFVITEEGNTKNLVAIRYPERVFLKAAFKSDAAFLARHENELYIGGGQSLMAFEITSR